MDNPEAPKNDSTPARESHVGLGPGFFRRQDALMIPKTRGRSSPISVHGMQLVVGTTRLHDAEKPKLNLKLLQKENWFCGWKQPQVTWLENQTRAECKSSLCRFKTFGPDQKKEKHQKTKESHAPTRSFFPKVAWWRWPAEKWTTSGKMGETTVDYFEQVNLERNLKRKIDFRRNEYPGKYPATLEAGHWGIYELNAKAIKALAERTS